MENSKGGGFAQNKLNPKKPKIIKEEEAIKHEKQAYFYTQNGSTKKAKEIYLFLLKGGISSFNCLTNLGLIYIKEKNYESAIDLLGQAINQDPNSTIVLTNLALTYKQLKKPEKALEYILRSINIDKNINSLGLLAEVYLDKGEPNNAIEVYNQMLLINPNQFQALVNIGRLYINNGEKEKGVEYMERSLEINPGNPTLVFEIAIYYRSIQQYQKAKYNFKKAFIQKPDFAEAALEIGVEEHRDGNFDSSLEYINKAININRNFHNAYFYKGLLYLEKNNYEAGIGNLNESIRIKFDHKESILLLANTYRKIGETEKAIEMYSKIYKTEVDNASITYNLASAYHDIDDYSSANKFYKKSIELEPNNASFIAGFALLMHERGKFNEALALYKRALNLKKNDTTILANLGIVYKDIGNFNEAYNSYNIALEADPENSLARANLGILQLLRGEYSKGWVNYDFRFKAGRGAVNLLVQPSDAQCNSAKDRGKDLLLIAEQGIGDTIQFIRFARELNIRGINPSICLQQSLCKLVDQSNLFQKVYTPDTTPKDEFKNWLPLLSVPRLLGISEKSNIQNSPYLMAPKDKVEKWKRNFANLNRPIVGINWQGNPKAERFNLIDRSLPFHTFSILLKNIGATFISLQKGFGSEQLSKDNSNNLFPNIQSLISQAVDFEETAAIYKNCDLIITTDTASAHLAGSMGKKTWLLLNSTPDWRWGINGSKTLWYPSMELFRQRKRGEWKDLMLEVNQRLELFIKESASSNF